MYTDDVMTRRDVETKLDVQVHQASPNRIHRWLKANAFRFDAARFKVMHADGQYVSECTKGEYTRKNDSGEGFVFDRDRRYGKQSTAKL